MNQSEVIIPQDADAEIDHPQVGQTCHDQEPTQALRIAPMAALDLKAPAFLRWVILLPPNDKVGSPSLPEEAPDSDQVGDDKPIVEALPEKIADTDQSGINKSSEAISSENESPKVDERISSTEEKSPCDSNCEQS